MELLGQYNGFWLLGLALSLLATGMVAGILAGLLGVGGGIVIVPVLYHLFTLLQVDDAVRMHMAVGTSLATIIPTSIMSARAHYRKGAMDLALLRSLGPAVLWARLWVAFLAAFLAVMCWVSFLQRLRWWSPRTWLFAPRGHRWPKTSRGVSVAAPWALGLARSRR